MTASDRRFHIGSAAITFAVASVLWFVLALSTLDAMVKQGVPAPQGATLRLAVGVTVPLILVTAVALVARNVTQSEAQSWTAAGIAFVIAAFGFVIWLSGWAVSYS